MSRPHEKTIQYWKTEFAKYGYNIDYEKRYPYSWGWWFGKKEWEDKGYMDRKWTTTPDTVLELLEEEQNSLWK